MKKLIFLAVSTVFFIQCQSQKISKDMISNLDNKSEKLTKIMKDSREDIITNNEHIIYTSANVGFGEVKYNEETVFFLLKILILQKVLRIKELRLITVRQ